MGMANSVRYLEKKEKDRSPAPSLLGNQNQLSRAHAANREPMTRKGSRQPPKSAATATKGTPITEDREVNAISPATVCARRAGVTESATAARLLGGIMPPPSPVTTLRAIKIPRLGAKADAKTPIESNESPINATGLLPKESDNGPTDTTDTAHAENVAVASCPATATEVSNSAAMATNNGANINDALMVTNSPTATAARKRNWLIGSSGRGPVVCVQLSHFLRLPHRQAHHQRGENHRRQAEYPDRGKPANGQKRPAHG